jgi:hypothetical protein
MARVLKGQNLAKKGPNFTIPRFEMPPFFKEESALTRMFFGDAEAALKPAPPRWNHRDCPPHCAMKISTTRGSANRSQRDDRSGDGSIAFRRSRRHDLDDRGRPNHSSAGRARGGKRYAETATLQSTDFFWALASREGARTRCQSGKRGKDEQDRPPRQSRKAMTMTNATIAIATITIVATVAADVDA